MNMHKSEAGGEIEPTLMPAREKFLNVRANGVLGESKGSKVQ